MSETPPARSKVQAMRELLAWAESRQTIAALEAIELLELTDEDLDCLFSRAGTIVRVPHLGKIS